MKADQKVAVQRKKRWVSGGSSTRKGAKQTAIGILVLILKQYESGGMSFRHKNLKWFDKCGTIKKTRNGT